MSEHYTTNTTGILKFCTICNCKTMHNVTGKRVGHCTSHLPSLLTKEQERRKTKAEKDKCNMNLFD